LGRRTNRHRRTLLGHQRPHRPPRFDVCPRLVSGLAGLDISAFPNQRFSGLVADIPRSYRCGGSAGVSPASQFSTGCQKHPGGTLDIQLRRLRRTAQAIFARNGFQTAIN
jgi:hypothetical protein